MASLPLRRQDGAEPGDGRTAEEVQEEAQYQMKIWKGFLICIPYAASIGGTATLTGTAPNLILIGQLKRYHPGWSVPSCMSLHKVYISPKNVTQPNSVS